MAIDSEAVKRIRQEALETALFRARLERASPAERERMLERSSHELLAILDREPAGEPMTDEEWDEWEREFDDEEPDHEVMAVVKQAQIDAQREVERRMLAGTVLAG